MVILLPQERGNRITESEGGASGRGKRQKTQQFSSRRKLISFVTLFAEKEIWKERIFCTTYALDYTVSNSSRGALYSKLDKDSHAYIFFSFSKRCDMNEQHLIGQPHIVRCANFLHVAGIRHQAINNPTCTWSDSFGAIDSR